MDPVEAVELILVLLAAMAVLSMVARRVRIPYPILFVLGGSALGLVPGMPQLTIPPGLVLLLFLPPLIYSAAVFASPQEIEENRRPIVLLAVGLVVATTAAVSGVAHQAVPELSWAAAFLLGATVSATDVTAVLATAEDLDLPRRIVTILEGEGLFNDATGLVLYRLALGAVLAGSFSLATAAPAFLIAVFGGLLVGAVAGWISTWARRRAGDAFVEITITLLTPFAAWIGAESLGTSGAVAVATAGIYIGQRRYSELPAQTRLMATAFWQVLTFIVEGLLFILTGLQLRSAVATVSGWPIGLVVWYAAVVGVTVIVVRAAWIFGFAFVGSWWAARQGKEASDLPDWKEAAVMSWAGLRGGEALAPALALPLAIGGGAPFAERSIIIFLTLSVIFFTMVLQGLTLPWLIRRLGLRGEEPMDSEESAALRQVYEAALARLDDLAQEDWAPREVVETLRDRFEHRLRDLGDGVDERHLARHAADRRLRKELIDARRQEALRLRDQGDISHETLRRIERALDLEEVQLSGQGEGQLVDESQRRSA